MEGERMARFHTTAAPRARENDRPVDITVSLIFLYFKTNVHSHK